MGLEFWSRKIISKGCNTQDLNNSKQFLEMDVGGGNKVFYEKKFKFDGMKQLKDEIDSLRILRTLSELKCYTAYLLDRDLTKRSGHSGSIESSIYQQIVGRNKSNSNSLDLLENKDGGRKDNYLLRNNESNEVKMSDYMDEDTKTKIQNNKTTKLQQQKNQLKVKKVVPVEEIKSQIEIEMSESYDSSLI